MGSLPKTFIIVSRYPRSVDFSKNVVSKQLVTAFKTIFIDSTEKGSNVVMLSVCEIT